MSVTETEHPTAAQHFRHCVTLDQQSAIDALSEVCPLSKAQLKECFSKGAVWLTQAATGRQKPSRLRRVKKPLVRGDVIELYYHPQRLAHLSPPAELILDAQHYSVWLKPRGMLSQGSKWGDHNALYRWVERFFQTQSPPQSRQAWIVHRLDRATAGLQILAHSKSMAQLLTQRFELRQIDKRYRAIVHGAFPDEPQHYQDAIDGRHASTLVTRLAYEPRRRLSLVEVVIETGRKHQIRKHLSAAGFPIVGDRLYGDAQADAALNERDRPDLQLTAYQLQFECPLSAQARTVTLSAEQLDLLSLDSAPDEPTPAR